MYVSRWLTALVLYALTILLLLAIKPSLMFQANGVPKQPGVGISEGKSMFAPAILFPLLALVMYLVATMLHFVWA
jgi:hypothetical protein